MTATRPDPRDQGEGYLQAFPLLPDVGSERFKATLQDHLMRISARVNGHLTLGTGDHNTLSGNLLGLRYTVTAPSTPDTDFKIPHQLGYPPLSVLCLSKDRAADIYTGSVGPNDQTITLRCTAADAVLSLWIF